VSLNLYVLVGKDEATDTMARDSFLAVQNALHSVYTQNVPQDITQNTLWKVQPVLDTVTSGC
jgi:hypothetical protein